MSAALNGMTFNKTWQENLYSWIILELTRYGFGFFSDTGTGMRLLDPSQPRI